MDLELGTKKNIHMLKLFLNSPIEFKETIAVMGIEYMFKVNY